VVKHRDNPGPPLRVVLYRDREAELYVAQCVEFDIAAHGPTPEAARQEFVRAYIRHVLVAFELNKPRSEAFPPAPPEALAMWEKQHAASGSATESFDIPEFHIQQRNEPRRPEFAPRFELLVASEK
jgi:hypothetical protein